MGRDAASSSAGSRPADPGDQPPKREVQALQDICVCDALSASPLLARWCRGPCYMQNTGLTCPRSQHALGKSRGLLSWRRDWRPPRSTPFSERGCDAAEAAAGQGLPAIWRGRSNNNLGIRMLLAGAGTAILPESPTQDSLGQQKAWGQVGQAVGTAVQPARLQMTTHPKGRAAGVPAMAESLRGVTHAAERVFFFPRVRAWKTPLGTECQLALGSLPAHCQPCWHKPHSLRAVWPNCYLCDKGLVQRLEETRGFPLRRENGNPPIRLREPGQWRAVSRTVP